MQNVRTYLKSLGKKRDVGVIESKGDSDCSTRAKRVELLVGRESLQSPKECENRNEQKEIS